MGIEPTRGGPHPPLDLKSRLGTSTRTTPAFFQTPVLSEFTEIQLFYFNNS